MSSTGNKTSGPKISTAEAEKPASAALHTLILDSIGRSVIATDPSGTITYINRSAEELYGQSHAEMIGKQIKDIAVERMTPEQAAEIDDRMRQGQIWSGEFLVQRLDGSTFPAVVTYSPLLDKDKRLIGVAEITSDISTRTQANLELVRAREASEAANRAKSEFLANMSHEIRTPMNGVIGMTELALGTDLTTEQRGYLELVKVSADSLLGVINDILDFSKIEAHKLDIDVISFDLSDALDETIRSLAPSAQQKGLELAYLVSPDVPLSVIGDPGRLRQIIINLINNALKFTEKGEVTLRVSRWSREADRVVLHFSVSDTGIGIPPEKQESIFNAFTQADTSTTRRFGGTGLGLAITSQLVALMGGEIWVESQIGQGSTFHFTLPIEVESAATSRPVRRDVADLQGMAVLVVDDNSTNRRILEEILINFGMKPTLVSGGAEAIQAMEHAAAAGTQFGLVLLDYQMPDIDGFQVADQIKQRPDLAISTIMMLSSVGLRGDAQRCRELGVAAYLNKPVRQSVLLDAICTVLPKSAPTLKPLPLVTRHSLRETQRPLHVLLAEDNAVNRLLAVRLLEKLGHSVVVANDGRAAVQALERERFDVILMDIQMPELDGFEATTEIRKREMESGQHVSIIALTAHAMREDQERCLAAGMDGYLSKPIRSDDLFQTLEEISIDRQTQKTPTPDRRKV